MTEEWDEPGQGMGDRINPRDIIGHLLIIWVVDYIGHSPTRFTLPGKPSDVIVVDVVDLDQADEKGYQGLLARKVWWRQARLIAMLKDKIGTRMLARMSQGTGSSGFNAPFELVSMLSDPGCKQRAEQWIKAHPEFKPSAPGAKEMNADLDGRLAQAKGPAPEVVQEKTYLEKLADQAVAGAARTSTYTPPPPPPIPDTPGF